SVTVSRSGHFVALMRLRNSVSSASGTFITRNGRIAALSLPVCSPSSAMALDLSEHRVRERESIRAQCEARLLRPSLRGHRLIVTLGRWRRHTALLERQCQQVYRSSAASLLHLGDRAVARDAVLLDAIELSLHARKEQVFAGRKSGDVRVLSGETG